MFDNTKQHVNMLSECLPKVDEIDVFYKVFEEEIRRVKLRRYATIMESQVIFSPYTVVEVERNISYCKYKTYSLEKVAELFVLNKDLL